MKRFLFLAMIFTTNLYAIDECEKLKNSKRLLKLIDQLETYEDQTDLWPGQRLSSFSYVLTDNDIASNCVLVLYDNLKRKYVETKSPLQHPNDFYNFYTKYNSPKNMAVKNFFELHNIETALALNLTNIFEELPGYRLRIFGMDRGRFYLNILLHEGFHLFTQATSSNWITWTFGMDFDRDMLVKKCYQDKRVIELFEREYEALLSTYQLMEFHRDMNLAASALKDYYMLNVKRYEILQNVTLRDEINNAAISCKQAEIIMEHREGFAEFYANMVMYNSGLLDKFNLFAILRDKKRSDTYYAIGMLKQLFLYRKLGHRYPAMIKDMLSRESSQFDQNYYIHQNL